MIRGVHQQATPRRAARVVQPHPAVRRLLHDGVPESFFEGKPTRATLDDARALGREQGEQMDALLGCDPDLWRAWMAGYSERHGVK